MVKGSHPLLSSQLKINTIFEHIIFKTALCNYSLSNVLGCGNNIMFLFQSLIFSFF